MWKNIAGNKSTKKDSSLHLITKLELSHNLQIYSDFFHILPREDCFRDDSVVWRNGRLGHQCDDAFSSNGAQGVFPNCTSKDPSSIFFWSAEHALYSFRGSSMLLLQVGKLKRSFEQEIYRRWTNLTAQTVREKTIPRRCS